MAHFGAHFARLWGAFLSITHYVLHFSEGKKQNNIRNVISALVITAAVDFFSVRSVSKFINRK